MSRALNSICDQSQNYVTFCSHLQSSRDACSVNVPGTTTEQRAHYSPLIHTRSARQPGLRLNTSSILPRDHKQVLFSPNPKFSAIYLKTSRRYHPEQRRDQDAIDFIYDLLKQHKQLGLGMSEEALVDHTFVRLEPQVQDYVEVRNLQNTVQLLEVLSKFEERYSCKTMRGSKNSDNAERRGWNEHTMSNVDNGRRNWWNSEVLRRPSNGRNVIAVITRMVVKEISGSTAGIDFREMIEVLTIEDTNL
ncbi:uncharacterized protein TNCV_3750691 [Trichonephila clavipes]|nr:uncharacterized protein TNCV_3750691 [Trichonephila clavipes]